MKHSKTLLLSVAVATSVSFFACKGKNNTTSTTDTAATIAPEATDTALTPPPPPPAEAAADDSLTTKANDAIKDYPGVSASVSNGEITLTGEISKAKLPKLLQAVNATTPKKVNNQLTIK